MKQTINFSQFCAAFHDRGRQEQFSYDGKRILFDYLEELGESCGEQVELDVIALCCNYSEDSRDAIVSDYDIELPEREDDTDDDDYSAQCDDAVREYLKDNTSLLGETGKGFVYASF
jgi:hypothetical protein